jgi:hypothetical protein
MTTKALTVAQPAASLIARGVVTVLGRVSSTSYRGPLAIYASAARIPGCTAHSPLELPDFKVDMDAPRGTPAQYLMRGESLSWPYRLPLGAVVATVELVDCVPIWGPFGVPDPKYVRYLRAHGPWTENGQPIELMFKASAGKFDWRDISGQLPYGDFRPGRYAWVLSGARALSPPQHFVAKSARGLWDWENTRALASA